jgi:hypothetical protein
MYIFTSDTPRRGRPHVFWPPSEPPCLAPEPWVKYGVRSPKFIWLYEHSYWLRPRNPPFPLPPAFGLVYEGAIGQPSWTTSLCDPLSWTQSHEKSQSPSHKIKRVLKSTGGITWTVGIISAAAAISCAAYYITVLRFCPDLQYSNTLLLLWQF